MKLKYYLRGIGIGVIMTTLILMIAFVVHKEQPLTDDEIRERAAELGMVMPDNLPVSDKLSDTEPSTQPDDKQEESDGNQMEPEGTQKSEEKSPETDGAGETKTDTSDKDKKEDQTEPKVIEQAEISIVGGEYSDDVCKKLKKAGIISDADDFNKYLAKGGYDNLIQPGNYVIPLDADYDTIVKLITEKKDKKR